jgi:hypothetical protein
MHDARGPPRGRSYAVLRLALRVEERHAQTSDRRWFASPNSRDRRLTHIGRSIFSALAVWSCVAVVAWQTVVVSRRQKRTSKPTRSVSHLASDTPWVSQIRTRHKPWFELIPKLNRIPGSVLLRVPKMPAKLYVTTIYAHAQRTLHFDQNTWHA